MGILQAIESSALSAWVRESPSIFAYTLILSLHAIGLAFLVGLHSVMSLRVIGFWKSLPIPPFEKFYPVMYTALWVNIISGLLLLAAAATEKLTLPIFYIKLALITAAVVVLIRMRKEVYGHLDTNGEATPQARKLAWSALGLWAGAIVTGRLSEYADLVKLWIGI